MASALASGFSTKQIIDYLLRKFPNQSGKIKEAMAAGFTTDQIIKFLSGGRKSVNEESNGITEHEKTRSTDIQRRENVNDKALGAAKMAAMAGGASMAAPMAMKALQRAAPQLLGPGSVANSGNVIQNALPKNPIQPNQPPIPNVGTNSPQQPPSEVSNIPQPIEPLQAQGTSINVGDILSKSGLQKHVDELSKTQKDPKAIAAILYNKFPKEMKEFQKESGKAMEDAIGDYLKSNVNPIDMSENSQDKKILSREEALGKFRDSIINKGSTVSSPEGIGEVKEIRNGKAIIEVDGKKHKINEDELEPTMFSEDEIADSYDNLFSKIPEEHRSGFIQWAGYDEDTNELGFIPRGGKYEVLENITPEEAKLIKEGKGVARTTGQNKEGLWISGEDTRGGIISQIIHDRKNKNKSKEDQQLKLGIELPKTEKQDRGMKPIFDELSYPRNLSKERERKKKLEERERLKREKDEAKKRKK